MTRSVLLFLLLSLLVWAPADALAGDAPIPRVVTLSDIPDTAIQNVFEGLELAVDGDRANTLPANAPSFLDPLRGALLRYELAAGEAGCTSETARFADEVKQAEEALDILKNDAVTRHLSQARISFACEREIVSRTDIARYLFVSGVLLTYQGKDGAGVFGELLAIKPDRPFPAQSSKQVQQSFSKAKNAASRRGTVLVTYALGALEPYQLYVDGHRQEEATGRLAVGRHFLQLATPGGKALAGAIVTLVPTSGDAADLPPPELRPHEPAEVQGRLEQAVLTGQPDPALRKALESIIRDGDYSWLLLVQATAAREVRALLLGSDGWIKTTTTGMDRSPPVARTDSRRVWKPGIPLTIGLGVLTLASAGSYGVLHKTYNIDQRYAEEGSGEWAMAYYGSGVTAALTGLGLVGTVISASYTWKTPAGLYERDLKSAVRLGVNGAPGLVRLELSGAW